MGANVVIVIDVAVISVQLPGWAICRLLFEGDLQRIGDLRGAGNTEWGVRCISGCRMKCKHSEERRRFLLRLVTMYRKSWELDGRTGIYQASARNLGQKGMFCSSFQPSRTSSALVV